MAYQEPLLAGSVLMVSQTSLPRKSDPFKPPEDPLASGYGNPDHRHNAAKPFLCLALTLADLLGNEIVSGIVFIQNYS